jgi:hypothetical protein
LAPPFLWAMHQSNLLAFVIVPGLFASLILPILQWLKIFRPWLVFRNCFSQFPLLTTNHTACLIARLNQHGQARRRHDDKAIYSLNSCGLEIDCFLECFRDMLCLAVTLVCECLRQALMTLSGRDV